MKARSLGAGIVAVATLLTGCAMGGAPVASAPQLQSSPTAVSGEITVWSWDVAATALKRLAGSYQKAHPGTTINVVDIGYDNAYDKISVGLQAGSGLPDLLTIETERLPGYIERFPGKLVDLSGRIDPEKANFDPSKLAAASDSSGKVFAMPWDSGTMALYVRTDYLKDAGVDPASLTTWDAFAKAAEQVKAKTGKTAFDTDLSTGAMFTQLMQQQGTGIFNAEGKIVINNEPAVAALTLLRNLQQKGLINNVKGWDARVSAAKAGKSAFSPNAVWWSGTLKSEASELSGKWAVQPLPAFTAGGAQTSNNGGSNLAVPAQAKNPDLAADFAGYALMNADNQNDMMAKDGLFPSYLPALSSPIYSEKDPYYGGQAAMKVFADLTAKIPAISYTGDYAKASEIVANASVEAILNGKDPKAALDDAAQTIAKQTDRTIG
ncbi:MAG: sugar ABC transporter substrate-binding protein [Micropruina sp.]|uniref:ABC transporter substrate-binding protein n=1 Tax=Micropruina sp. TaxID=2737536 RepID=UPI0039E686D1